jgi:ABC-type glycerol-3-phosphate transport system substrate-binding protein
MEQRSVGAGTGRLTRRRWGAALAGSSLVGVSGAAIGCGPAAPEATGQPAAGPTIRAGASIQWAWDDGPTRTPLREEQLKLFAAQFPTLRVETISGATSAEKLQALIAAGTPPDLLRQETPGMAFFSSRNQLAPLDALMKRDKYDLADFFPTAWELWKWKGKQLGVPFLGIRIAYFNRSLAQQAGARIAAGWRDPEWSWDAFLEATRKVTVRDGNTSSRWGAEMGTSRRDWQAWVWSNGGELFSEDGTKVLLDQPAAVAAIQYLADLIHKHRVMPTPDELKAAGGRRPLFEGGNLLSYHEPVNGVAANRRGASFDWSITGLPRGKARAAAASGGGVGWFLTAGSKAQDETWELMKFLASKESVRLEAVRGEAPPSRKSVAAEPAFVSPPEPPRGDMKVVVEALELMHLETPLINGVEIDRVLTEELDPVWAGSRTVAESIAQAVARVKPLLNPAA